jgi:hypothetical protein
MVKMYFAQLSDMIYGLNGDSRYNYIKYTEWYKPIHDLNDLYSTDIYKCFWNWLFVVIRILIIQNHSKMSSITIS